MGAATIHRNGHTLAKPLPNDNQAERDLIGELLVDRDALEKVRDIVRAADFMMPEHQTIFASIVRVAARGELPEVLGSVVIDELQSVGQIGQAGGEAYIAELAEGVPHAALATYHAGRVAELGTRRRLIAKAADVDRVARDLSVSLDDAITYADGIAAGFQAKTKDRFEWEDCESLHAANCDVEYLIDDVLPMGQPCVTGGISKSLKTSCQAAKAIAGAFGLPFLGKFRVSRPFRTLFMSAESGRATLKDTCNRICTNSDVRLEDARRMIQFAFDVPDFTSDKDRTEIRRKIERDHTENLVIDPFYLAAAGIGDGAGSIFKVGDMLKPWGKLVQDTGVTIDIAHHCKKSSMDPYEPVELKDLQWSGIGEWVRAWMLIGRREKYIPDEHGYHKLWATFGGSAGHGALYAIDIQEGSRKDVGGRRWNVQVFEPDEAKAIAVERREEATERAKEEKQLRSEQKAREKVLKFMADNPNGVTKSMLKNTAKINTKTHTPILADLLEEGEIVEAEVMRNNRSESGFKLAPAR